MKKTLALALSILLTTTVAFAQKPKEDKKALKKEKAEREFMESKDLVNAGAFTFVDE